MSHSVREHLDTDEPVPTHPRHRHDEAIHHHVGIPAYPVKPEHQTAQQARHEAEYEAFRRSRQGGAFGFRF